MDPTYTSKSSCENHPFALVVNLYSSGRAVLQNAETALKIDIIVHGAFIRLSVHIVVQNACLQHIN